MLSDQNQLMLVLSNEKVAAKSAHINVVLINKFLFLTNFFINLPLILFRKIMSPNIRIHQLLER